MVLGRLTCMYDATSRRTPGGSARNTTDCNAGDIDPGSFNVVLVLLARFVSYTRGICR